MRMVEVNGGDQVKIKDIKIGNRFRKELGNIDALAESIEEHGLIHPPTVNKKGELIAGLRRIKACERLGWNDIKVHILDLDDIIHGEFDENVLRKDFTAVEKVKIIDALLPKEQELALEREMAGASDKLSEGQTGRAKERAPKKVGWSRMTYEKAKEVVESAEENPDEYGDLKEKLDESVSSAFNELERREDIKKREEMALPKLKNLLLGNCLERIDEIEDRSIDVMITDPPYGIGKQWGRGQTMRMREDWDFPYEDGKIFGLLDMLFEKAKSKLKPDSLIYIFTSWRIWHKLFPIATKYFDFKSCLCWIKNMGLEGSGKRNYRNCFDLIFFGSNGKGRYLEGTLKNVFDGIEKDEMLHPTQKPVELVKKLIQQSTVKNETVFDPFCGSGTTLVAAELLDRNWIGIEIEKRWYDIARERIANIRNELFARDTREGWSAWGDEID